MKMKKKMEELLIKPSMSLLELFGEIQMASNLRSGQSDCGVRMAIQVTLW